MPRPPEPSVVVVTPNGGRLEQPTTHLSVCDAIARLAPVVGPDASWPFDPALAAVSPEETP